MQLRELTVMKKTGKRVPFDRDKLARSIQIALRKRPVDPERIDRALAVMARTVDRVVERAVALQVGGQFDREGAHAAASLPSWEMTISR